jgi:uncharacterized phage protein (predicted DNA packaging)
MTDEEKKEYKKKLLEECKKYDHIDYDDDEDIVEIMLEATFEEMSDLIPDFDQYNLTFRQRLLVFSFVKELYDNREKYQKDAKSVTNAVSSMLLKEIYGGGRE